jgi:hypothetical protein
MREGMGAKAEQAAAPMPQSRVPLNAVEQAQEGENQMKKAIVSLMLMWTCVGLMNQSQVDEFKALFLTQKQADHAKVVIEDTNDPQQPLYELFFHGKAQYQPCAQHPDQWCVSPHIFTSACD